MRQFKVYIIISELRRIKFNTSDLVTDQVDISLRRLVTERIRIEVVKVTRN